MFDDLASQAIRASLDGLAMRQRVQANNIANIETPNFKAKRVEFETALSQAIAAGDGTNVHATLSTSNLAARQDGNNVNLDEETLGSTETGLRYQTMLRAMDDRFGLVSAVLKGVR
ncbi:flagellar basal body rod protein FlgB [Actinokineospora auranticolor]|uniref:Flagellar basal body rod protein FlgB n=1 Tax=Actinokineospora auranticolor TaxID=155976 RepID=A0A2S6GML0_9PSEU|nr:flagellar basal body rod protein FlgB [Actinokineospora auranticolor]PPK66474.1 flagellar basal-body rod protein FlgB [Actinokineospora auranticolor]